MDPTAAGPTAPTDPTRPDTPGRYRYHDDLPASGTTHDAVRAFDPDDYTQSPPSNAVTVKIKAPAAGDP
ncbi:MAG: hypothetical protein ACFCVE_14135 [Phycisphaerae bacterium]